MRVLPRDGVTLQWTGVWRVPETGVFDLTIHSHGRSSWRIDDQIVHEVEVPSESGQVRAVRLEAGLHPFVVRYEPEPGAARIDVNAAISGEPLRPLDPRQLKPRLPRNPRLRAATEFLRNVFAWIWAIATIVAIRATVPRLRAWWSTVDAYPARFGRYLAWLALAGILDYGALLRLDAITAQYGTVTSPSWVASLQTRSIASPAAIRPAGFRWEPSPLFPHADGPPTHYRSDPYEFVTIARERPSFYEPTYREPLFPFTVRVFLWLFNDQDVAVSFTSTAFSMLAIWFTYLLGTMVWSRWVGLIAAFGLAVDGATVSLASNGWRDDAFVAAVALCAVVIVRAWRRGREKPATVKIGRFEIDRSIVDAAVFGVVAGLAILVRVFALSFIIPAVALLFLTLPGGWRRRWSASAVALGVMLMVGGPYYFNCWRVHGNALLTLSVHGNVYRVAEGKAGSAESLGSTADYLREKFTSRPFEMFDTVSRGLTDYHFSNKWPGLDRWRPGLGAAARIAALIGLVVLAGFGRGRVLLFVMLMAVAPFSLTWRVDPNWRFTAHTYPFLLTAAGVAVSLGVRAVAWLCIPGRALWPTSPERSRIRFRWWFAAATLVLIAFWFVTRQSPALVFREALRTNRDAEIASGTSDAAFFGRGWSSVVPSGPVRSRVATGQAEVSIPLPERADYPVTLRLDPFPRPLHDRAGQLPAVEVVLNGAAIGRLPIAMGPRSVRFVRHGLTEVGRSTRPEPTDAHRARRPGVRPVVCPRPPGRAKGAVTPRFVCRWRDKSPDVTQSSGVTCGVTVTTGCVTWNAKLRAQSSSASPSCARLGARTRECSSSGGRQQ